MREIRLARRGFTSRTNRGRPDRGLARGRVEIDERTRSPRASRTRVRMRAFRSCVLLNVMCKSFPLRVSVVDFSL